MEEQGNNLFIRKTIKQGSNTLTITLPKEWTARFNIGPGAPIHIYLRGKSLVLSPDEITISQKAFLDATGLNLRCLDGAIIAAYKSGFDELEISFEKEETLDDIQKIIRELLLGYEIIEESENRCIIRNISSGIEKELGDVIKRNFLVVSTLANNSLDLIKKERLGGLKGLCVLKHTNSKLTYFCHRMLNKTGYKEFNKTNFVYLILWLIDRIAERYSDICILLSKKENSSLKIRKEIISIYKEINEMLSLYQEVFYKFDKNKIVIISDKKREIMEKSKELLGKTTPREAILLMLLLRIAELLDDLTGSTFGLNY